jgi:hypothetical protein
MFVGILGGGACLVIHLLRDDDLPGVSLDLRPPVRLRARAWWLRFLYLAEFPCRYLPLRALAVARACAAVCVVGPPPALPVRARHMPGGSSEGKLVDTSSSIADIEKYAPAGDAFYTPPEPLPEGTYGDPVYARRLDNSTAALSGGENWLVLYRSQGADGRAVATSGIIVLPDSGRFSSRWRPPPAVGPVPPPRDTIVV